MNKRFILACILVLFASPAKSIDDECLRTIGWYILQGAAVAFVHNSVNAWRDTLRHLGDIAEVLDCGPVGQAVRIRNGEAPDDQD